MLNRRSVLQGMAATAGAAFGSTLLPSSLQAASTSSGAPKRIIFFMQKPGLRPADLYSHGCEQRWFAGEGQAARADPGA